MKKILQSNLLKNIPRQTTFKGIAVVSGVFTLVVAALMLANQIAMQSGLPEKERIYSAELVEMKNLLSENPKNEALKEEIRQLDLQLRQEFFERKAFAERGKYLLLLGVVIFLLSMKQLIFFPKPSRRRKSNVPKVDTEGINSKRARYAVSVLGIILLMSLLPFAYGTRGTLPTLDATQGAQEQTVAYPTQEEIRSNWPRFRGPGGLGIVHSDRIPTYWNEETGEGISWKKEIPLPGNNSPIVWGDRVFLSGGNEDDKVVYCYSTGTGNLLWQKSLNDVPVISDKELNLFEDTGYASSTMACDGSRVYAIFADGVIGAFDFEGNRVWAKHLGVPENMYGYATSLLCYQHQVIVQFDQGTPSSGNSVLYAFEGDSGEVAWQSQRDVGSSWTTPIVIDTGTEKQLITCAESWVISYNPDDGKELWRAKLLGMDLAPSPIYANGLVFAIQSSAAVFAIRPDGRGDVTESHLEWRLDCPAPEITSPVSNGKFLFMLSGGYLACHSIETSELLWEHDTGDMFMASPTLVGEWIYMISEEGTTYRVKAANEIEEAEQKPVIHDRVLATPAFQDNQIFIRGEKYLYGIGGEMSELGQQAPAEVSQHIENATR